MGCSLTVHVSPGLQLRRQSLNGLKLSFQLSSLLDDLGRFHAVLVQFRVFDEAIELGQPSFKPGTDDRVGHEAASPLTFSSKLAKMGNNASMPAMYYKYYSTDVPHL